MKGLLQSAFLALLLPASWLPATAQARPHVMVQADVPFKFKIGERSFRPGSYEFLSTGTNMMALRDGRSRVVASLVTRPIDSGAVAPSTKLVFRNWKKHLYLSQIKFQDRSQILEILGEELAIPQTRPPETTTNEILLFSDRKSGYGMKRYRERERD